MPSAEPEIAATQDPGGGPPGRVDVSWLLLHRLDDVRREQDALKQAVTSVHLKIDAVETRLRQEIGELRQSFGEKYDRLVNWFIVGLLAIVAGLFGIAAALVGLVLKQ